MAYGELKVTGEDVYEALTLCGASTRYERVLNDDGERLAQLIAHRVIAIIQARLACDPKEEI